MNFRTLTVIGFGLLAVACPGQQSRAEPPIAGWSSMTGYRHADTAVRRAIVANASNAHNRPSGPSYEFPAKGPRVWYVDTHDGDGIQMRSAITSYAAWKTNPKGKSLSIIKAEMNSALSNYESKERGTLVERIVQCYDARPRVVSTNQETLDFLGIRKQCLEWANAVSWASGGGNRNYSVGGVTSPDLYRPGMGFYRLDSSHAAIIIDIEWDKSGKPIRFKLAEANFTPDEWNRPDGQIPWNRTIFCGRQTTLTGHKVVSFD